MMAALSLMVIFIISFSLVRVAAVAIRLTGLPDAQARFQALSALTGTGFTTAEAELIVNYPIRRKIISYLMIIGNLGLVSVVSTIMISFLRTDADFHAIAIQTGWILGGVGLLYILITNPFVDKLICGLISTLLKNYTLLGQRRYTKLLQLGDGVSIAEHHLANGEEHTIMDTLDTHPDMQVVAVRKRNGATFLSIEDDYVLDVGDGIILLASDDDHDRLSSAR